MTKKIILFCIQSFFSLPAFAGGWTSGGGDAVVCGMGAGRSATLLDIYEGKVLEDLQYLQIDKNFVEGAIEISKNIPTDLEGISDVPLLVKQISKRIQFLPSGVGLSPIDDSAHILIPKKCIIAQVARMEPDFTLYVDSDIWNILDRTSQSALLVHEALYLYTRAFGAKDSSVVRRTVALASSSETIDGPKSGIPEVNKICQSELGKSGLPSVQFSVFRNSEGQETLQFSILDGLPVLSKSTVAVIGSGLLSEEVSKDSSFSSFVDSRTIADLSIKIQVNPTKSNRTGFIWVGNSDPIHFLCR